MKVRCEECGTIYNFPEDKLSSQGTPVKCKVCGHVFVVHRESAAGHPHAEGGEPVATSPEPSPAEPSAPEEPSPPDTPAPAEETVPSPVAPPATADPEPAWGAYEPSPFDGASEIRRLRARIPESAVKFALGFAITVGVVVLGYTLIHYTRQALEVYTTIDKQIANTDALQRKLKQRGGAREPEDLALAAAGAITRGTEAGYQEAVVLSSEALGREPNLPDAHAAMAEALAALSLAKEDRTILPEAKKHADDAARLSPESIAAARAQAAVALAAGNLDDADKQLAKAVSVNANAGPTQLLLAKVYLKRQKQAQAAESLAAALAANPLLTEANYLLAQLYGNKRDWEHAVRYAEAAVSANPKHEDAQRYLRLAREQFDARAQPQAARRAEKEAGLTPSSYVPPSPLQEKDSFAATMRQGRELARRGQLWEAIGKYRKAVELSPSSCEAHVALGRGYYDLNESQAALDEFNGAAGGSSRCAAAYLGLGSVYQDRGQKIQAVANYEQFLRLSPTGQDATEVRSILENLRRNP